jgi:transposase
MPGRPKRISAEGRDQIVELGRQGISAQRIAVRFKLETATVAKLLAAAGVKPTGVKEMRKRLGLSQRPGPMASVS